MAVQCSLSLLLLAVLAHNALSYPTPQNSSAPPLQEVNEKRVQALNIPVGPDGNEISCENSTVCIESVLGPESHCVGTHCQCTKDATQSPTTKKCLIERDTLGSGCEEDWQCTRLLGDEVTCTGHLCSCKPEASVIDGKCWKQIPLGGSCTDNEQCIGGHDTICNDQICQCISSKVPHPDNRRCLEEAQSTGDLCIEAIQCTAVLGDGASCRDGKCQCLTGFHNKNKGCVINLILEEKCVDADGECYLRDSFGLDRVNCNNTCQCKEGFIPSNDRTQCLVKGQPEPSPGGAASISPYFATIVSIMLARKYAS